MDAEALLSRAGVFVLVLVVTVGAVGAGPIMQSQSAQGSDAAAGVSVSSFQPEAILQEPSPGSGTITMTEDASEKVVLVDISHGNDIAEEQLGPILSALSSNGAQVEFLTREQTRGSAFNESLREADAFVAMSPGEPYTDEQVEGLSEFAAAGGRVLLMQEPMQMTPSSVFMLRPPTASAPAPMAPLASEFGLAFGNGYLYNMGENDNNYRKIYATPADDAELVAGVDRVVIREGTPVHGGEPVLTAVNGTTLSTTRAADPYPIAATSGNVTAIGDTTFFTETGYQEADNEALTGQLLDFLVGGEKPPGVPGETTDGEGDGTTGGEERPPRPPE